MYKRQGRGGSGGEGERVKERRREESRGPPFIDPRYAIAVDHFDILLTVTRLRN